MPRPRVALPPQYNPHDVERRLYRRWLDRGVFTARADSPKRPYVIVMPPPNVTAILHMGHGLNTVIQDLLIRFERMRGREALWLPGTDHAGIATQNVVERLLARNGENRFELGREAFVERVWAFVRETGNTILEQLKVIGCSCDWSRTRFTLVPALPHGAVRRGSRVPRRGRHAVLSPLPRGRRGAPRRDRGHHAPGDAARRRGRGGAPRGRPLRRPGGQDGPAPAPRPPRAHHRRRRRGSRVRHRRGEGHAGARRQRFRDRAAPRAARAPRDDRRRPHERRERGGPRPGRGARARPGRSP